MEERIDYGSRLLEFQIELREMIRSAKSEKIKDMIRQLCLQVNTTIWNICEDSLVWTNEDGEIRRIGR